MSTQRVIVVGGGVIGSACAHYLNRAGWQVTIQCQNHGTVPNSCAVVSNAHDKAPMDPSWSTPNPVRGLDPGQSASFAFTPTRSGSYRIASLVGGNEASGMWLDLEIVTSGRPTLTAPGS